MRLSEIGKIDIVGYGSCFLPSKVGCSVIKFHTWVPKGSTMDEAFTFFVGNSRALKTMDLVASDVSQRSFIETKGSADVLIECNVMLKNFQSLGIMQSKKHKI